MIEERIDIDASPEAVMACYQDVPGWSRWDPDTRWATLDGPFRAGATGILCPSKGFAVRMHVVGVTRLGFVVESPVPLCTLRFEHELAPIPGGTRVTHRVVFCGPLSSLFGRIVGRRVRTGLPVTLANLKRLLERGTPP